MAGERDSGELFSQLMLSTSRLCPPPSDDGVQSAVGCMQLASQHPRSDAELDYIPLTSGSVAEFYVDTMLSCTGDIDFMIHLSSELALPASYPLPTQLPPQFDRDVRLFEIIDSDSPGYVYLKLAYLLSESADEGAYAASEERSEQFMENQTDATLPRHGPASCGTWTQASARRRAIASDDTHSFDIVFCVRCLVWPPQAVNWPTRHGKHGWPDSATVDRVVANGCDVVGVPHRQFRKHEWEGSFQWRLSFSRAEVALLNSWAPVQQIVYHMLRVYVKTERLTDSADASRRNTLSNYHIKTLVLWACELKARGWWTADSNLVRICAQLLQTLAVWVQHARCQHYFIRACNLLVCFDYDVAGRLASVTKSYLSAWFQNNYLRRCADLISGIISFVFGDGDVPLELAVTVIEAWRKDLPLYEFWTYSGALIRTIPELRDSDVPFGVRAIQHALAELNKTCPLLVAYYIAVMILRIVDSSKRNGRFGGQLVDALTTICLRERANKRHLLASRTHSVVALRQATMLMKSVASKPFNTTELVEIELSKVFLHRALRCRDSNSDFVYCLANVYIAALYFATGQHQTTMDHCKLVTRNKDHSSCNSHVVEVNVLPNIDSNVAGVLGLVVLYQYLQTTVLNEQQQIQNTGVFSTELFAHYLYIKCLSAKSCSIQRQHTADALGRYYAHLRGLKELLLSDVLLYKRLRNYSNLEEAEPCGTRCINAPDLNELLLQSAVEHLTTFRQLESRQFGSIATIVTTDFEALYAYRCGEYRRCLRLCQQNVRTLTDASTDKMSPLHTFPEFVQLMDDEIVSLVGLAAINVNVPRRNYRKYVSTTRVSQLTMSLYLLTQCQLNLRQSATSLDETLNYIVRAKRTLPLRRTLDCLTLKLIECKLRPNFAGMKEKRF